MKPLLLGMNNPLSDDPEYDLYPYPEGCTGWRLWKMLPDGTPRTQYLEAFDRRNVLHSRAWDRQAARQAGQKLLPELMGRVVVVLGSDVRAALGLPPAEPLLMSEYPIQAGGVEDDLRWVAFPHPSGRNRWFNDPGNQFAARQLFQALWRSSLAGTVDKIWEETMVLQHAREAAV